MPGHYGKMMKGGKKPVKKVAKKMGMKKKEEIMPFSKYSPKQKKIARVAPPRNKITGADFKVLRSRNAQKNTNRRKKA